jgi:threonine synthase
VQQDTCAPMVKSWRAGSATTRPEDVVSEPTGIAEAILRGNPTRTYPHLQEVVALSGGTFLAVSEAEIVAAQGMVLDHEGISICPSSATTVAAIRKMVALGEVGRDEVVFANLTGGVREETITPREYVTLRKADLLQSARKRPAAAPTVHP